MDEVDRENLDTSLSARGRWRRKFLQASNFMGALAAVGPWFANLHDQVSLMPSQARISSR